MIRRKINPLKSNSFFIFGARGTGKSTFVKQQFFEKVVPQEVWTIDLLDADEEEAFARDPKLLERKWEAFAKRPEWIFIDEVQKVPKLLDHVHRMIETHGQKFALTGSSARRLKRDGANLLAGRAYVYSLFPFSFLEIEEKWDLPSTLNWGSLPKTVFSGTDDERRAYLKSYAQTYVREEVLMEQLVRDLEPFREFLEISAQMNGKIINASKIAKEVGVTDKTVHGYYQILQDTYLGFMLPAFHRSVRKAQISSPRFYYFDVGLKRQLDRSLVHPIAPGTSFFGETFEHHVILEATRMNSFSGKDHRLSFFRSKDGREIDLIVSPKRTEEILVEIQSSSHVDETEVRSLSRLSRDFNAKGVYYLSLDENAQVIDGVRCLPWKMGLNEIFG